MGWTQNPAHAVQSDSESVAFSVLCNEILFVAHSGHSLQSSLKPWHGSILVIN